MEKSSNSEKLRKAMMTSSEEEKSSRRITAYSPDIIKIITEGGENFYRYFRSLNLSKESDLVILSSSHHYYFDEKELEKVRTLVNLKKLNHIKDLKLFLQTLYYILPPNASLMGCFSDDKTEKKNGIKYYKPARLFRRLINFIDSKPDRILDKSEVSVLLEANGFRIVDMTEMSGLIYFYSQNLRQAIEIGA